MFNTVNILNFYFKKNYYLIFIIASLFLVILSFIISFNNIIDLRLKFVDNNFNNAIKINKIHDDYLFNTIPSKSLNLKKLDNKKSLSISSYKNNNFQTLPKEIFSKNLKKLKFISSILPIVAHENKKILAKRSRLFEIQDYLNKYKTLDKNDQYFIENLALEYRVVSKNKHKVDIINQLIKFVDVIPNSIVIAQAANESGWGSSRFAKEFNALFGEYTYDVKNGIVPYYREEGKKHLIKSFPSISESIQSYFNNINTHSAYENFRKKRKFLRDNNLNLDPLILSSMLSSYAEDKNYVRNIQSIIKVNNLTLIDNVTTLSTSS